MIHFFLTRDHAYTLELYLQTWGRQMRDRIGPPIFYEQLPFRPWLPAGTYIFSDLERLTPAQTELAIAVHQQLVSRPAAFQLLNDPARVLRRHDLLRTLHAQAVNCFNARKIDDSATSLKFPVFLRNDSDHKGAISPLLNDASEVDRAIAAALASGQQRDYLLLVEFLESKDAAGIYRKFGYFRIGDRLIPRHVVQSRKWVVKYVDVVDPATVDEEMAFLKADPHAEAIRKIFDLAHVDYGRIDYTVVEGKCQIFEINTNPTILVPPGRVAVSRLESQGMFGAVYADAMVAIDHAPANEAAHRVEISGELSQRMGVTFADRALRPVARLTRWLGNRAFVKRLT